MFLSIHYSYEPEVIIGKLTSVYIEHNKGDFALMEVISYPRTVGGTTFHRNCSFYKESYGHRGRAYRAAERAVLGEERRVYLPVHDSDKACIDGEEWWTDLTFGVFYVCLAALVLLIMFARCHLVGKRPALEDVEEDDASTVSSDAPSEQGQGQEQVPGATPLQTLLTSIHMPLRRVRHWLGRTTGHVTVHQVAVTEAAEEVPEEVLGGAASDTTAEVAAV